MKEFEISVVYRFNEGGFFRKIYNIIAPNVDIAINKAKNKICRECKKDGIISIAYAFEK